MPRISAIVIGRNEGARLVACLDSLGQGAALDRIVYVDSGSTDGSVAAATAAGAQVVILETEQSFTAARARNAGIAALGQDGPVPELVQFVDGDCQLDPAWITKAVDFLTQTPKAAVVCGRRRERFPEASVYNRLCDAEWDTPIGEAKACGGDALIRWEALQDVGGYNAALIAGEEPEMCLRLRRAGWQIWRINAAMTLHDAAMTRFGQFWKRARRSGFARAEGAAMYGRAPERHGVLEKRRALIWGLALPVGILLVAVLFGPWWLLALGVYPAQVIRLSRRIGFERALFLTLGKFAETAGILEYHWRQRKGGSAKLIEYK